MGSGQTSLQVEAWASVPRAFENLHCSTTADRVACCIGVNECCTSHLQCVCACMLMDCLEMTGPVCLTNRLPLCTCRYFVREVQESAVSQVELFLNSVPILSSLTKDERMRLVDALEEVTFAAGTRKVLGHTSVAMTSKPGMCICVNIFDGAFRMHSVQAKSCICQAGAAAVPAALFMLSPKSGDAHMKASYALSDMLHACTTTLSNKI